ncbi:hypothetical protein scyTo_0009094 [Scyliorhinus torazame]|uniref:SUMO-activating enzyme subunit 2 C-terminal domain-containing protein n=1 Tax=Scyliorhinus torazame TaxID=75743 RepID=A0A401NGG0_SCYTO|nr:hypothetical protein [Scyliorhinus torazame]
MVNCSEDLEKDIEFEVVGDAPEKAPLKPSEEDGKAITNGSDDGAQPSTSKAFEQDDVLIVDSDEETPSSSRVEADVDSRSLKRKMDDEAEGVVVKRFCTEQEEEDDDIIALD